MRVGHEWPARLTQPGLRIIRALVGQEGCLMSEVNPELVDHLRSMARRGATVSQMLRDLVRRAGPEPLHPLDLVKYVRASFGLGLREASPIGGWSVEGNGYLSDAQLDELVDPEVRVHRPEWDRAAC